MSSLDSLSLLEFTIDDPQIKTGIDWFIEMQKENGLWDLSLLRGKDKDHLWISLEICCVFKRFYDS